MRTLLVILLSLVLCGCAGMYASQEVREKYVGYFPHLSAETKADILSGRISIGMTMEEVKASWNDCGVLLEYPITRSCSAFGCVEMYRCNSHYLQDWIGHDLESKGQKWEMLTARSTPEEKRDIFMCCKSVIRLPYSVITRLIWRKILHNYRTMPGVRHSEIEEVEKAVDEVLEYIPIIRRQKHYAPRGF